MPPNSSSSRAQQLRRQQRVADRLGVEADQVAIRDELRGGVDADLTSGGVRAAERAQRSEFAAEADFVRPSDVAADVGRRNLSVEARVARSARDDVEERAVEQSAEDAEFVTPSDLDAEVGKRGVEGVRIPDERRDDVADRAESSFAAESEFITGADVDADVGERGVADIGIPDERRDDVESRLQSELLGSLGESAKPSDLAIEVTESGIERAGLKEGAGRSIAARDFQSQFATGSVDPTTEDLRQFAQQNFEDASDGEIDQFVAKATLEGKTVGTGEFALGTDGPVGKAVDLRNAVRSGGTVQAGNFVGVKDVDIGLGDVERTDSGFGLDTTAQRRVAADKIEETTPISDLDPTRDITQQGSGFGLAGSARREFAAEQFEDETALDELDPSTGLTRTDDGFGLSSIGERRLAARNFEQQTELEDVDPQQDILLNDDGSAMLADRTETRLAAEKLDQQVEADVTVDDIERVTGPDGDTEFEFVGGGR